jgi:hypothetical protein
MRTKVIVGLIAAVIAAIEPVVQIVPLLFAGVIWFFCAA